MMRLGALAGLLVAIGLVTCVDGKTPDCSTPESGCYPSDANSNGDAAPTTDGASTDADADADTDTGPADATID